MRALGEPAVRLGALMTGAVDATLISYGFAKQAEAKGFRILAYSGDYVSSLSANLETSDDKIKSRRTKSTRSSGRPSKVSFSFTEIKLKPQSLSWKFFACTILVRRKKSGRTHRAVVRTGEDR